MEEFIVTAVNWALDIWRRLPWHWLVFIFHSVLAPLSAFHAMMYKRDSRAALGWVAVCLFFPLAGPTTYYLFGINRIQTEAKRLLAHKLFSLQIGYERGKVTKSQVHSELVLDTPLLRFSRVGERLTSNPLTSGNKVQLLQNGEQTYPAMISAINAAKQSVYLTTYIFETDSTGRELIDALGEAKTRGVDVRVILDGFGELYSFPRARHLLRKRGINVGRFLPPKLLPPTLYVNLRNHRKILVVDGVYGFTGGMNLGGRHMVKAGGKNCTADIHFSVSGPVVRQLQSNFVSDWKFITGEELPVPEDTYNKEAGQCYCRCINDGPNEDLDQISLAIKTAIATALHSVVIMTPYFLPSREMIAVLQSAALRGVEITVILPEKSNLRFVDWATRNLLWELLQYDIQVLLQPPPFAHSKLLIVDGYYAQIGSANQDPRSLRLNFELNMEVIGEELLEQLRPYVDSIFQASRQITLAEVDNRLLVARIRDAFFWLFLPYL